MTIVGKQVTEKVNNLLIYKKPDASVRFFVVKTAELAQFLLSNIEEIVAKSNIENISNTEKKLKTNALINNSIFEIILPIYIDNRGNWVVNVNKINISQGTKVNTTQSLTDTNIITDNADNFNPSDTKLLQTKDQEQNLVMTHSAKTEYLDDIIDSQSLIAPIKVGNEDYICEVVVEKRTNRQGFYLHKAEITNKLADVFKTSTKGGTSTSSNLIITEKIQNFNPSDTKLLQLKNTPKQEKVYKSVGWV